jgi:hypothetical protein
MELRAPYDFLYETIGITRVPPYDQGHDPSRMKPPYY